MGIYCAPRIITMNSPVPNNVHFPCCCRAVAVSLHACASSMPAPAAHIFLLAYGLCGYKQVGLMLQPHKLQVGLHLVW